jgi:hypothetical protein
MPSAVTGWLDRMVRWYWIRRTGSDPVIILHHLRDMEALNSLHVEFCEQLEIKHPELKSELDKHEQQRFDLLNPPNARTQRRASDERSLE